jgi:hypothetical protein
MLFILVALFALFLGWQKRWIRQRREYLKAHPEAYEEPHPRERATAPMLLWIWGEPAQIRLNVQVPFRGEDFVGTNPSSEAEEIRRLFPEAIIEVQHGIRLGYTWHPGQKWAWGK